MLVSSILVLYIEKHGQINPKSLKKQGKRDRVMDLRIFEKPHCFPLPRAFFADTVHPHE
jgi:hypothetical protein